MGIRLNAIGTTTSSPAADDYFAIDGTTNGTRKILVSSIQYPAYSGGDVTATAGSAVLTIGTNTVTLAKMAQVSGITFLGKSAAGTGNVEAMSQATARTALGLGGAAYLNVGTSASTVCAGDDGRLSNSRQCNNNFDNAATARSNLGLGGAATLGVGSTAGTVCAGDDGRLSNSRQCNNNFDNAGTARSNLGLGNAATRNITFQSGGTPSGGSDGDLCFIY